MKLYIDFDRTLFDTARFVVDRDRVLRQKFGIEIKQSDTKKFYRYVDDLYLYDFYEHMANYGLSMDDIDAKLKPELKKIRQTYIYSDAKKIINDFDFSVLTFGQQKYQELKFELTPELGSKEKIVVLEHKDEYLTRERGAERVALVDDKLEAARQHPLVDFIHLERSASMPLWQDETGLHINSLTQLPVALDGVSKKNNLNK